jgi:hypothetical protein
VDAAALIAFVDDGDESLADEIGCLRHDAPPGSIWRYDLVSKWVRSGSKARIFRDAARGGSGEKRGGSAECGRYRLDLHWISPGLAGSRSGPEDWARRWAQLAPFVNYTKGVKGLTVDIGAVIKVVMIWWGLGVKKLWTVCACDQARGSAR